MTSKFSGLAVVIAPGFHRPPRLYRVTQAESVIFIPPSKQVPSALPPPIPSRPSTRLSSPPLTSPPFTFQTECRPVHAATARHPATRPSASTRSPPSPQTTSLPRPPQQVEQPVPARPPGTIPLIRLSLRARGNRKWRWEQCTIISSSSSSSVRVDVESKPPSSFWRGKRC